uniref:Fucosyltransferase n=1 Tax=Ditylenchus dipsaci TaxID=166011 RepID=A0A915EI56_9BILA
MAGLKRFIEVDVYGGCGDLKCAKQDNCQNKINSDYHFYYAAENSICTDYITEKLWNQGYGFLVVPIVLRRKIVEKYVPPHSFIAVDDYPTIQELAIHLKRLISNREEYMKYFEWRRDYQTIILDQRQHASAERLWGFCQVCRLTQLKPRPTLIIQNMEEFWDKSCEKAGEFVDEFLRRSVIAGLPSFNSSAAKKSSNVTPLSTAQNVHSVNKSNSVKSLWKTITY